MKSESAPQRTVLVTGGTGVLGAKVVRILRERKYSVTAHYARDEARAQRLQSETNCGLLRADVSSPTEVARLFAELPSLYAVVHAVGVVRDGTLAKQSRDDWDETLRVHATGAFLVMQAALTKLEDGGRFVVLTSRVGERGREGQTAYAAAKAAQIALMKCAAREGAMRRIAVNALCPGFVPSAMSDSLSTRALEAARCESVWHEFGNASQVASMVSWLLSEEATGITGQIFHCDSRMI